MNYKFETTRLILRRWRDDDAQSLFKYAQNPNIGPIAGWPPHTSIEDSREIIKNVLSADETYAVVLKQTGEAVGSIGLMLTKGEINSVEMVEGEGEIGYWIGEPFWGQGLIPEAVCELLRHSFEDLKLTAVWCGYYDGNEKSKRVQEKCGFIYHNTEYNKPVTLMNDFRTVHYSKMLREDWGRREYTYLSLTSISG